jgi:hypothetical protein
MFIVPPGTPITAAQSKVQTGLILNNLNSGPFNLCVEAEFAYGSGGTSCDAYLQTSLDGGSSFFDVANFHFTTSSTKAAFNLSSLTPVTTQLTAFDNGSLASNTAVDGILGNHWRVIITSVGTYAATTLGIWLNGLRLTH